MTPEETRLVLQIEANVKSLERAMRQGGIIVDKTTKAMNDNYANVGRNVDRVNRQIEASTRNATRNLGFQFQDISTQLMSGTSPFTIMAQQASQAGTAIDDLRRSGGVLKGIGGALGGLFSPGALGVSAAILGFGYLAQAAQKRRRPLKRSAI
ncbi:phage tail length tape measure family protein [Sinorhizobium medicae]|uniref:phage tail length tape measure family protein n=1 Tax=Sinorhizobium medicae TaxID=110321 RepID=UPI00037F4CDF|nr:phage tail length tape measure family protein [Sinorhizobium medicae]